MVSYIETLELTDKGRKQKHGLCIQQKSYYFVFLSRRPGKSLAKVFEDNETSQWKDTSEFTYCCGMYSKCVSVLVKTC